jgi:regulator of sigma E protease
MLTTTLAFAFVIGVLVFVHELGHFLAARRIGIKVLTFSVGFGPKLLKFHRGDTEYCVSAIPLGGYVKMAGESPEDEQTGSPEEFMSRTKWERFQVLIMGPVMNIVLAVVVMTLVLYQGAEMPAYEEEPPVVGTVVEGSEAESVGIEVGERIVSVEGHPTDTWGDLLAQVMPRADRAISVEVLDPAGRMRTIRMTPDSQTEFEVGDLGVGPLVEPQVIAVSPGEPADNAGVQSRDVIEALDGKHVSSKDLIERINASAGQSIRLTVRRGDSRRDVDVVPALVGDVGLIGVSISPFVTRTIEPGFVEAFQLSLEKNYEWSGLIFQTLAGLFTAQTSPKQLVGPVGIAQLSGDYAELGMVALFSFLSMLSLNLGILNLLPVPVLDGGHIVIMALEGVSRRDFSMRVKERMLLVGFALLMMLMVTVVYNDLARIAWIERLMPWR